MGARNARRRARKNGLTALALALCVGAAAPACAQRMWKPEGPVEISVPSSPGGGTDHTARVIQKILQERQLVEVPVSVVNKSGRGGFVALAYLNGLAGVPAEGSDIVRR